jgi:hypothetical protein
VKGSIHCATGDLKGCKLIFFFFFFFTVEGEGVEVNVFFFPRCMKRWKQEGERGTLRVQGNVHESMHIVQAKPQHTFINTVFAQPLNSTFMSLRI